MKLTNRREHLLEYGAARVAGLCECKHEPVLERSGPWNNSLRLMCYCGKHTIWVNQSPNKLWEKWMVEQEVVKQWRKLPRVV